MGLVVCMLGPVCLLFLAACSAISGAGAPPAPSYEGYFSVNDVVPNPGGHDIFQFKTYHGQCFSQQVLLDICDELHNVETPQYPENDCFAVNIQGCMKTSGIPSPGNITWYHETRCSGGLNATITTSVNGRQYKTCPNYDACFQLIATFPLPPFLCHETCEQTQDCVAFSADGAHCSTYTYLKNGVTGSISLPPSGLVPNEPDLKPSVRFIDDEYYKAGAGLDLGNHDIALLNGLQSGPLLKNPDTIMDACDDVRYVN